MCVPNRLRKLREKTKQNMMLHNKQKEGKNEEIKKKNELNSLLTLSSLLNSYY